MIRTLKTLATAAVMSGLAGVISPPAFAKAAAPAASVDPGQSETKVSKKPYLRNIPKDAVFDVVVLGDSLADGLYAGLYRLNRGNSQVKVTKKSKVNTGLVRSDRYDWNKATKKIARSKKYQVAVVLLGLNDLQTFRTKGKRKHFKQKSWVALYEQRLEKMIVDLKAANMAVYWVGIPITSPKRYQKEYAYMNNFYRKAAEKHGIKFVDTWSPLAQKNGGYSAFWKASSGKKKKIRTRDGVHFTPGGYEILATFVNNEMQRDIADVTGKQASK